MFYYYFKSKQDIYIAAMEQYITQRLERKCKIIEDETVSFDEKLPIFRSMVEEDIQGYMERLRRRRTLPFLIHPINSMIWYICWAEWLSRILNSFCRAYGKTG